MASYEEIRQQFRPAQIKWLLIAESPPPEGEGPSSRRFYQADYQKGDDRLFVNTVKALYSEAGEQPEVSEAKEQWLRRLQEDGVYLIEALTDSQPHEVTKEQRQEKIREALPGLIERVKELAGPDTAIVLIKSNVYEVAAEPLRDAGFNVLNKGLVDYPGRFNQRAYREKLRGLLVEAAWQ